MKAENLDTRLPFLGKDLTGQSFFAFTVISFAGRHTCPSGQAATYWNCRCKCGNTAIVRGGDLACGKHRSCGCEKKELARIAKTTHGGTDGPLYSVWSGIRKRCLCSTSEDFQRYGGRGIKICERWNDFESFKNDMLATWMPGMTIERKDNNGPYSPENCVWATRKAQANNRSTNRMISFGGKTMNLAQWAKTLGMSKGGVARRIADGWPIAKALTVSKIM